MQFRGWSWCACLAFACSGGDPAGEPAASSNDLDTDEMTADDVTDDASGDDDSNADDPSTGPLETGCREPVDVATLLAEPTTSMPSTMSGTLCGADALWLVVDGAGGDVGPARIQARLEQAQGPYTLTLFEVVDGQLSPMRTERETNVLTLDESTPEWVFAHRFNNDDPRVVMQLEGPAGDVDVSVEAIELAPYLDCQPQYEYVSADWPTVALPASFETELCSARDARVVAFDVEGGRPVTVTLDNPYSIEAAQVSVLELASPRTPLPLVDGVAEANLGLLAYPSFTFTPAEGGPVGLALYSTINSRGEPMRISVTQE